MFFLKKQLQLQNQKIGFLPEIITIEKLITKVSALQPLENIPLLFRLYESYQKINETKNADSFEQFIKWAPIFLSDCNEIDRYLVATEQLFNALADIERFKQDDTDEQTLNLLNNQYGFSKMLDQLYSHFTQSLKNQKKPIKACNTV